MVSSREVNNNRPEAPRPAYEPPAGSKSPLFVDTEKYSRIAGAKRKLIQKITISPRTAEAWKVPKGCICRLTTPEGPQVGDLNMWNANNPRERFWASRTRQFYRSHLTTFDRFWSNLPFLRPLATIVGDSLADYGTDRWNGRIHDLLGTRCDPYVDALLSGNQSDTHCHSNLVRSVLPYGLTEFDVHDVLNVFQVTGLNEKGQYFMGTSPSTKEDYFEFFAETDLLCALSACPGGDLSLWGWGDASEDDMLACCRPLGVEVYAIDDDSVAGEVQAMPEPENAPYSGRHGLKYAP